MANKKADQIYIVSCGPDNDKKYKVGVTSDINQRLKSLQTGNPEKIILEYIDVRIEPTKAERYLHRTLHKYRQQGEWFKGLTLNQIRAELLMYHDQK